MATTGQLTFGGTLTQAGIQMLLQSLGINIVNGNFSQTQVVLQSGNNAITVPALCQVCIIVLPPTNAVVTKIKGPTSGDAGTQVAPAGWTLYQFDPAGVPATININSASTQTGLWTNIIFI